MQMGASSGAALAFLIAGPATNAAAFTTIWKVLGGKTAAIYIITVAVSALAGGLLLDWLVPMAQETLPTLSTTAHSHAEPGWLDHTTGIILIAVLAISRLVGTKESIGLCRFGGHAQVGRQFL